MSYEALKKLLRLYEKIVEEIGGKKQGFPPGSLKSVLVHNKSGDVYQYYCREDSRNPTGRYLGREEKELAKRLARKEYCEKALRVAERERKLLSRFLKASDEQALLKVYTKMNEGKRILIEPYVIPDEEYARRWQAKKYTGGSFEEGESEYYTKRGDRVRSKSEQIIADRLYDAGVPYRYEYPLIYDQTNYIYTDFTVLNKRTRVIFRWEHFGRMDDPKYRKVFFWKQSIYSQYGYIPGVNYICTFEDNANPLDTRVLDKIVRKLLL